MSTRKPKEMVIQEYLARRWDYLCGIGWHPSCGKVVYIQRNTPYVRRNIQDNPDYLEEANKKLGSQLREGGVNERSMSTRKLISGMTDEEYRQEICADCEHLDGDPSGWCYMFKDRLDFACRLNERVRVWFSRLGKHMLVQINSTSSRILAECMKRDGVYYCCRTSHHEILRRLAKEE